MIKDYSGQNLRGRSFKGQNLEGANFSYADIRGANFANANLSGAKAGLQDTWKNGLLIITWFLSALLGFITTLTGLYTTNSLIPRENIQILAFVPGLIILVALSSFFVVSIRKSLRDRSKNIVQALHGAVSVAFSMFGASGAAISLIVILVATIAQLEFGNTYQLISIAMATTLVAALVSAYSTGLMLAVTGVISISRVFYGIVVAFAAFLGGIISINILAIDRPGFRATAITMNVVVPLMAINGGWKSLIGDENWLANRSVIISIASWFGTSFCGADLTNADLTEAILKNTNFRKSILTRTRLFKVQELHLAAVGTTYLNHAPVKQLVITLDSQDKNFNRLDLRGINLQGGKLMDTSFVGTDLSEANLQDADLSRAKLVQTQLDGTDLTGATLTGATIEDWGITSHTKLCGVRCEYVFMRLVEKGNPDQNPRRKPDNWNETFADGDFADFIQPIFDTLDLYHNQGVDPRAIAIAFKQLAENNPDAELEIVAMEKRGLDKFLLRAKTAARADKSELSTEYFDNYNQLKALPEREIKLLLAEKDSRIRSLETMVVTALERPGFYAETYNNKGDTMSQNPKKQSTFNLQGSQFGGGLVDADTVNAEQIGGNITNYTTEQKQNLTQVAAEIRQLLTQLEQTNPTTTSVQKMAVVAQAVDEIEKNLTLKARVVGALESGGTEALKEALDHPLVNIFVAAVEGWQDAD